MLFGGKKPHQDIQVYQDQDSVILIMRETQMSSPVK